MNQLKRKISYLAPLKPKLSRFWKASVQSPSTSPQKSFRSFLGAGALLLSGLLAASSASAQAQSFLVTKGEERFDEREMLDLNREELRAGEPLAIRITALDGSGDPYEQYDRGVTVRLRGMSDQTTSIYVPGSWFVDGVAELDDNGDPVEIIPVHAARYQGGFTGMRFSVTDGNIETDNASGFFTIAPAGYSMTYQGSNRDLRANDIIAGISYPIRVSALNADGSIATGWRDDNVQLRSQTEWWTGSAWIGFGGTSEDFFASSLFFHPDDAPEPLPLQEVIEYLAGTDPDDPTHWQEVVQLNVLEPAANRTAITVDEHELVGTREPYPGEQRQVRYRLNNETDTDHDGPIDVVFELRDRGSVLLRWSEQVEPDGGILEADGQIVQTSSFVLPQSLAGYRGYTEFVLHIRPNYAVSREEEVELSVDANPDLYIRQLNYTAGEYRGGEGVRFHLTFENLTHDFENNRPTAAVLTDSESVYKLQLHLSEDAFYGNEDDFLVWERTFSGNGESGRLLPGQLVDVIGDFMLPNNFDGAFHLFARINSSGGRDGRGFTPESWEDSRPGNNTTPPRLAEQITILPHQTPDTFRVSVTSGGGQSDGSSDNAVVSRDGAAVAFESSGELAGTTSPGMRNIFIRNLDGANTILVSAATSGAANGHSGNPSISSNGHQVVFQSGASNLVAGDTNGFSDVFVRDVVRDVTRRLSVNPETGQQANHGSQLAKISGDGRFVVFESGATNLVSSVTGLQLGRKQVYLYDRSVDGRHELDVFGNTELILVSQINGRAGSEPSTLPAISGDGRFAVFVTQDPGILGLPSGSPLSFPQIVRWDRLTDRFAVVSAVEGMLGDNISGYPAINGDGSHVVFASRAQNLTAHYDPLTDEGDFYFRGIPHVFRARLDSGGQVKEMLRMNAWNGDEPDTWRTSWVPVLGSYEPSISEDGKIVTFTSEASNLLPPKLVRNVDQTYTSSEIVYNYLDTNDAADVYLYDFSNSANPEIRRASVSRFGYGVTNRTFGTGVRMEPQASRNPTVSPDGRFVVFTSATKGFNGLIFGETNYEGTATNGNFDDIYVFDLKRGLTTPQDLPVVNLLMPSSLNATAGSSVTLRATGSVSIGSLAAMEFYVNGNMVGSVPAGEMDYWGQFQLNWQAPRLPGNPHSQRYDVVAVAVASNGSRSEISNISKLTVNPVGGSAPFVSITNPSDGTSFTNRSAWPFSASVVSEHDISSVEFFIRRLNDDGLGFSMGATSEVSDSAVSTVPFDFGSLPGRSSIHPRVPPGTYLVTAVARDVVGNVGQSGPVLIFVRSTDADRPTLMNFSVNPGAVALGEVLNASVEVADPVPPIVEVGVYGNGNLLGRMETGTGGVQSGKYWSWQGMIGTPGVWDLYAIATDASGNRTISDTIQVTVGRAVLRLDVPENVRLGDSSLIELEILAGDVGIGWVDFFVNGEYLETDFTSPYWVSWVPQQAGHYKIEARAWAGYEFLTPPPVTVSVVKPPVPPQFVWEARRSGTAADLHDIVGHPSGFTAVGANGTVLTSSKGTQWSSSSTGTASTLRGVVNGDGVLVAVGDIGSDGRAVILSSANWGQTWKHQASGTTRRLSGVTYGYQNGLGRFVAVGSAGVIRTSDNGADNWINRASGVSENLHSVAYGVINGEGLFVAVGENGVLLTSRDAIIWKREPAITTAALHDVTFGNGRFVATGGRWSVGSDSARILTSFDGINWTISGSGIPSITHAAAFGGGGWVAAGTHGIIASSADGLLWNEDDDGEARVEETLHAAAYGEGKFIVVGRGGVILTSAAGNFQTWAAQEFAPGEHADPAIGGLLADPYGWGVPNLLRYALGIDSAEAVRERMPQVLIEQVPQLLAESELPSYLTMSYVRSTERKDLSYIVEVSSDLVNWTTVQEVGGSVSVESNDEAERVIARDGVPISVGGEKRFLRLRIEPME